MKKFYLTLFLIVAVFAITSAQVPAGFNYQAVVRNSSGEVIANKNVSFRVSILKGSASGTVVYSETHSATTNAFGLVTLNIGGGTVVSGTFDLNDWKTDKHFIKTEIDPAGGSSFSTLGTSELLSVPYAIHAQTVENDKVDDADANPTNEIQTLSISGTLLELSNGGGSVTLPSSGGGSGDNWGTQKVVSDATLTGEGTTANPLSVVTDGDGDDTNELQTISKTGSTVTLSNGGGTFTDATEDADADPQNEIQQLSISGTLLELSNGGGSVTLPSSGGSSGDNWGTQKVVSDATLTGEGTTASPLSVVADGDGDDTNELQTLSLNGNDLSLSDGGTVTLPSGGSSLWEEFNSIIYRKSGSVAIGTDYSYGQLTIETTSETGISNEGTFEGSGLQTGLNNKLRGSSDANRIGIYNDFKCTGSGGHTGVFNFFSESCNANKTGTANTMGGGGDGFVTGTSNDISSSGNGTHYGVNTILSGTGSGTKYGTYNKIESSAGGTHYAVYGEAEKTGSYAGYFKGTVAIKDGTQGAGRVLTSDADGNASWQTPAAGGGSSLWTESGGDVYRSGKVGIGAAPTDNFTLDIKSTTTHASMRLKSTQNDAVFAIDRAGASDLAEVYYSENGTVKFHTGLNGNDNYEISCSTNSTVSGITVTQSGDVETSSDINVGGNFSVSGEANFDGDVNTEALITNELDVNGDLYITKNPGAGKVLTSDANGIATWQTPATGGGSSLWSKSGNDLYYTSGKVAIGRTSNPLNCLLDAYTNSNMYAVSAINNGAVAALYASNLGNGAAAVFGGKIVIDDGTQGTGKVLTSDADGNASWQTPASGGGSNAWTESGDNIYRSGGYVGIGKTSPDCVLDIYNENNNATINLKSNASSAFLYLDKKTAGYYAEIGFQVDGVTKFYSGLTSNGNYEINASTGVSLKGMEVETDGDVHMTNDLIVNGEVHATTTGNANMIPVIYGSIDSDGTIYASSGNFTVSKSGGEYLISSDYFNFTESTTIPIVSPRSYIDGVMAYCRGNIIVVKAWDKESLITPFYFSIVVYQP